MQARRRTSTKFPSASSAMKMQHTDTPAIVSVIERFRRSTNARDIYGPAVRTEIIPYLASVMSWWTRHRPKYKSRAARVPGCWNNRYKPFHKYGQMLPQFPKFQKR